MKKDILTTIGGLVAVGLIVVATFLYGNHQRQQQLRTQEKPQTAQQAQPKQSQDKNKPAPQTSDTSQGKPQQPSTVKPSPDNQTGLQGGSKPGSGSATQPTPNDAHSQPATPTGPQALADTGGEALPVLAAGAMALLYQVWRRSRLSLSRALVRR